MQVKSNHFQQSYGGEGAIFGRRVAILHAGEVFACRQCRNLVYGSQLESEADRLALTMRAMV